MYPALLARTSEAPPVLYFKGNWQESHPLLTVVGTRTPTRHGEVSDALSGLRTGTAPYRHRLTAYESEQMHIAAIITLRYTSIPLREIFGWGRRP